MIIVTGSVTARSEHLERLKQASSGHVLRSRTEPGCIRHSVLIDCENPLRLFFYEVWADYDALVAHFKHPGSLEFIEAVRELAAETTGPEVYEALPASR
ncbi:MAG: antibiotic biosynthesis monooxygenase [Candidatus Eremiobacteraeota bacterium]|nr:antibiotic biosynthesis monooxygenase [Candidatus Eremiobacteraeota bacterium]